MVAAVHRSMPGRPDAKEAGRARGRAIVARLLFGLLVAGCSPRPASESSTSKPENQPAAKSASIRVVMVPKNRGGDYFIACEQGAKEAAKELGVELQYDGPVQDNPERQAEIVETWIQRRANVIAISCNDASAIAPVLKKARKQGIHVITWDADADKSAREFFINQAPVDSIGNALVDVMAKEAGADAKTAIITSTLEAPNQNAWIKAMKARIQGKFPKMTIVATEQSKEDPDIAFKATQAVLKSHPDVEGIFAITSNAFPGAAEAVLRAGKAGKIAVTGLANPKKMKQSVHANVVKTVILWNPVDLGYLTIHAAKALVKGDLKPGAKSMKAGRLGDCKIRGDEIILGDPAKFTKDNIDKFNF